MGKKKYAFPESVTADDIRRFRKQQELTQAELGSLLGVSTKTIERWESSKAAVTGPHGNERSLSVCGICFALRPVRSLM